MLLKQPKKDQLVKKFLFFFQISIFIAIYELIQKF